MKRRTFLGSLGAASFGAGFPRLSAAQKVPNSPCEKHSVQTQLGLRPYKYVPVKALVE